MNTHVSYELGLPGYTSNREAVRLIDALRLEALALNASEVTPLWRLSGREVLLESPWHWPTPRLNYLRTREFDAARDERLPLDIVGFFLRPGRQASMAAIGIFRLLPAEDRQRPPHESDAGWYWGFECETVTADSEAVLLRLLHRARRVGF